MIYDLSDFINRSSYLDVLCFFFSLQGISNEIIALFLPFRNYTFCKGQIISECPYEIIVSPKIPTKKFPRFLP